MYALGLDHVCSGNNPKRETIDLNIRNIASQSECAAAIDLDATCFVCWNPHLDTTVRSDKVLADKSLLWIEEGFS